LSLKESSVV